MVNPSRRTVSVLIFFFFVIGLLVAQTPSSKTTGVSAPAPSPAPLVLEFEPAVDIPLGSSSSIFSLGGGMDLGIDYRLGDLPLSIIGGAQYCYAPAQGSRSLSLVAAHAGLGVRLPVISFLNLLGHVSGGYYYAAMHDQAISATNPYVAGGGGVEFRLTPSFALFAQAQYQYYFGLWQGLSAGIGASISLDMTSAGSAKTVAPVDTRNLKLLSTFNPAFPVFYKYYNDHSIGNLHITNNLDVPISNVKVQFYIKQYMDEPKEMILSGDLSSGSSADVPIYALFTDSILNITEGTKSAASMTVSFEANRQSLEVKRVETLEFLGRNAMTWDDDRKAAAYVTTKDPAVLQFARSVTSKIRGGENRSIEDNLQAAIALHEALDLYGLDYVPNPVTPYSQASTRKEMVDFLQFPRQTFQYKAGDCSDISILYCALLQAVGIDTAFVTIPGHIFVAVRTTLTPEQASQALIPVSEYIEHQNKVWIPVEITMRHQGFLKAWELGAREWNENNPRGKAGFYPVQEAWAIYPPVGLPGISPEVQVPSMDLVASAYRAEAQKWADNATYPKIAKLQAEIKSSGSVSAMNKLGVIYAKYGHPDKAEEQFKAVLAKGDYVPAILNLGNLFFIREDWQNALVYYEKAYARDAHNSHALLAIARAHQQLKNYDDMKQKYEQLKQMDPQLAGQYAYLGTGSETGARSADVDTERKAVLWEVE